jgi:hypothetical protein
MSTFTSTQPLGGAHYCKIVYEHVQIEQKWPMRLTHPVFYPVIPTANYGHKPKECDPICKSICGN